jgi:hypothetical protein
VPFIQPDFGLSNLQIGLIASALSFSWAIAGLVVGRLSDHLGRRKIILVIATLAFSCASILSGFAAGFVALLGARLLMGIAEGGIMPISQSLIAAEVAPERRGLAQGITQNFGANVIANFLGPVVIVAIALAVGWRNAFLVAALPGFLMAVLIALLVHDPKGRAARAREAGDLARLLADRTIILCISSRSCSWRTWSSSAPSCRCTWCRCGASTRRQAGSWPPSAWRRLRSRSGPRTSDYLGRRPVAVRRPAGTGAAARRAAEPGHGAVADLRQLAIGAALSGVFPLVMATIPSKSCTGADRDGVS